MKLTHTIQTIAKNGQKLDIIGLLIFHCETKFVKSDNVNLGQIWYDGLALFP